MKWYFIILGSLILAFVLLRCAKKELSKYKFIEADMNNDEVEFMLTLNNYRKKNGLKWVMVDEFASLVEHGCIMYMMANGISHEQLQQRRSDLALNGATNIQEIVTGNFTTVKGAFLGFVNSPKHEKIILDKNVNTCGISIQNNSNGKKYVAVIFFKI